jgi:hypothetical protein
MPNKETQEEKTQNVKFTEAYRVQDKTGTTYEKDKVYELPESSAKHYVNRKVAVLVDEEPVESPQPIRDESKKSAEGMTAADVRKMLRADLDDLAKEKGIDLGDFNVSDSKDYLIQELGLDEDPEASE